MVHRLGAASSHEPIRCAHPALMSDTAMQQWQHSKEVVCICSDAHEVRNRVFSVNACGNTLQRAQYWKHADV